MKRCPVCKMTVNANNECPICKNTITFEPRADSEKEKLKVNKYLVLYLLKHCWFSLACLIKVTVRFIIKRPDFNAYCILIFGLTFVSIMISLFERRISRFAQRKYSPEYSVYCVCTAKILFGLIAVVFSLVMW